MISLRKQGYKYQEIADIFNMSASGIYNRINYRNRSKK